MLLYAIALLFVAVSILCLVISYMRSNDCGEGFCLIAIFIFTVIFLGLMAPVVANHISKNADTAEMVETYESLYAQAYYRYYENDNDVGKKELADQITEWNKKIVSYSEMKKSIWVSLCYPIDIEKFNTIPIELLGESVG